MSYLEQISNYCEWAPSRFLFLSENVFSSLIYYSHLLPALICLVLSLFLIVRVRNLLAGKILIFLCLLFTTWSFFDLITWANEHPDIIMFFWSALILLEPVIFVAALYFLLVFLYEHDISLKEKSVLFGLIAPTIIFLPTEYAIHSFNLTNCEREVTEGWLVYYGYIIEVGIVMWAAISGLRAYRKSTNGARKSQILLMTIGILLFLLAFSWGNISGSLTEDWSIGQYGLLGMPVFIAFLVYVMVTYKTFKARIFGTQALVASLWLLLAGILFIRTIENVRIITSITLIITLLLGYQLVRSVKREIEQREKIEKLADDLEKANSRLKELDHLKSEFLSFASHQIRSPLTAIKGYTSMLVEGDFGKLDEKVETAIKTIDTSAQSLIVIVNEFLDISRIEQGRMKYEFTRFDAAQLAHTVVEELRPNVEGKGLTLTFEKKEGNYIVNADQGKIKQVFGNIIDNAMKYTPNGSITVSTAKKGKTIVVTISDTGVGIDEETIPKLFSKFSRAKDAHKTNVSGTGLGLYVAKNMLEAQNGSIRVESEGKGKGSQFIIELEGIE